ncbi:DUF4174 domain-containing protein [Flammeovirga sp. SJP92]|uniref:DUF4174 domain-containing protein n=1 Tax=Flammeovirga sp. SJP92 TaxID=1775430 RepID=UPI00155FCE00|nr:DUF4174 domain-containing protein [Flammeovirga sp. SJP92]
MKRFANIFSILLLVFSILFSSFDVVQNLSDYKWTNRVLIINAPISLSEKFQNQLIEIQQNYTGLRERKIVLITIVGTKYSALDFTDPESNTQWKSLTKELEEVCHESFEVVLIGLDGSEKLRQTEVLYKEDLFQLIDRMPMRRLEMNEND